MGSGAGIPSASEEGDEMNKGSGALMRMNINLGGVESGVAILKTENITIEAVKRLAPEIEKYVVKLRDDLSKAFDAARSLL